MKLKYFDKSDFDSPDEVGSGERMNDLFLKRLDQACGHARIPFVINSGYRTEAHNRRVGGTSNSSHLKGLAADIKCVNDEQRSKIVNALIKAGFNRIGIAKSFIHVDIDGTKNAHRIWVY